MEYLDSGWTNLVQASPGLILVLLQTGLHYLDSPGQRVLVEEFLDVRPRPVVRQARKAARPRQRPVVYSARLAALLLLQVRQRPVAHSARLTALALLQLLRCAQPA